MDEQGLLVDFRIDVWKRTSRFVVGLSFFEPKPSVKVALQNHAGHDSKVFATRKIPTSSIGGFLIAEYLFSLPNFIAHFVASNKMDVGEIVRFFNDWLFQRINFLVRIGFGH